MIRQLQSVIPNHRKRICTKCETAVSHLYAQQLQERLVNLLETKFFLHYLLFITAGTSLRYLFKINISPQLFCISISFFFFSFFVKKITHINLLVGIMLPCNLYQPQFFSTGSAIFQLMRYVLCWFYLYILVFNRMTGNSGSIELQLKLAKHHHCVEYSYRQSCLYLGLNQP